MMLQYIADSNGKTAGVFIPYTDWEKLVEKYKDIENDILEIPEWHKKIVMERIKKYDASPEKMLDWDVVSKKLDEKYK
ncbi:MAG: addiction module protein [Bacteroidia bacterium]|nr:addiction module protein [Bacteroidia bacterium]